MLRTISALLFTLLFALAATGGAMAGSKTPPGKKGSTERNDWCFAQLDTCETVCDFDFGDYPATFLPTCKDACDDEYAECITAPRGATLGTTVGDILQSPGMLDESDLHVLTVPVGEIGPVELEHACTTVGGAFARSASLYGCVNACVKSGSCTVVCQSGKCQVITPDLLQPPLTLIGLLQNGRQVVRGPDLPADSSGASEHGEGDGSKGDGKGNDNSDGSGIIY